MSYIASLEDGVDTPVYIYPRSLKSFTNYTSIRVLCNSTLDVHEATLTDEQIEQYGAIWHFFSGEGTPTRYRESVGVWDATRYQNSVDVLPGYVTQQKAQQLNELIVPCGSKALQSITCYNLDGTVQSLSGRTLEVVVSEPNNDADGQTVIDTIANASITVSGTDNNVATWRYTALMVAQPRVLLWALRDVTTANDFELQGGTLNVRLTAVDL